MELFEYYTLDECIDKSTVLEKLDDLKNDGKITYTIDGEILQIEDIDLEEYDIEDLKEIFEDNDVFPYLDRDSDNDDDEDYNDYYDEEEDY